METKIIFKSVKLYPSTALLLNKLKGRLQQENPKDKITDDKVIYKALENELRNRDNK